MVLKEWGEIRQLYKATYRRILKTTFARSKVWRYWYAWLSLGVFLSSPVLRLLANVSTGRPNMDTLIDIGLMVLTGVPMWFLANKTVATEFKEEYATHGIKHFPYLKRRKCLCYALFLHELAERGYTSASVGKLKGFGPVAEHPEPDFRLLQHPSMVPLLTIGTVLSIEAIKQSDIWQKTSYWWIFFYGLLVLGFVMA
jgi:hypothetical protein